MEKIFLLSKKEYIVTIQNENNKILIEAKEKDGDIPFSYQIYLTLEEFKKKINIFDTLEEVKVFLENILKEKENIQVEIDDDEENITLIIYYYITTLKKNIKFTLTRTILSNKKMIDYLLTEIKLLKKSRGNSLDLHENKDNYKESELITNEDQLNLIKSGIQNLNSKNLKLKLLYKASRDGDNPYNFHSKCDNISPTITIFKTGDNYIFGGYVDKNWDNHSGGLNCNNAFLFSFDKMKIYPGKNGGIIYCSKCHGPWFSYALGVKENGFLKKEQTKQFDLDIFNEFWNNFDNEYELNGGKKNYFIKEIEVFHLDFI